MTHMAKATSLTIFAFVLIAACDEPSNAPGAQVLTAAPTMLDPDDDMADDLTIDVHYTDGDADLGGGSAEVIDCRADKLITTLLLPPIASEQAIADGVPIEGDLTLLVADIGRVDPDSAVPAACAELGVTAAPSADSVVFCVVLVDAAGHRGGGDCTDSIAITAAQ